MTVTQVTKDATLDDLSVQDYRDIFTEVREKMSLDKFVALSGSQYSKAQWSKYEHDETMAPSRAMRNDLRRAVGKKELPLTVAEAVGAASPDAAVWQVGDGVPQHVIMVGDDPVTIHVNETVQVVALEPPVTELQAPPRPRRPCKRMWVTEAQQARLAALGDVSDSDIIEAGLRVWEAMP